MGDERSSWERRLEALDEQLATFGVRTEAALATDVAVVSNVDVPADGDLTDDPPPDGPSAATDGDLRPTDSADPIVDDEPDLGRDATPPAGPAVATDGVDELAEIDEDDEDDDEPARPHRALLDWVVVIGVALVIAFLMRTFVLAHFVVDGESMESTLQSGDRVFVNKLSYRLHDPNRGDVVVLHQLSGTTSRDLIKRVLALPGEVIEVRDCQVTIDGQRLEEPYLDPEAVQPGSCGRDQVALEIPDNHVFVMGDNRGSSMDSRDLGPVDEDNLVGRAFVVFWPQDDWKWL